MPSPELSVKPENLQSVQPEHKAAADAVSHNGNAAAEQTPNSPEGASVGFVQAPVKEIGGRDGPEPTRFGDWEKNGRCIDF